MVTHKNRMVIYWICITILTSILLYIISVNLLVLILLDSNIFLMPTDLVRGLVVHFALTLFHGNSTRTHLDHKIPLDRMNSDEACTLYLCIAVIQSSKLGPGL